MVHRYLAVAVLGLLGISLGCAMGEDTYDYAYPAYGSVHPRADRFHGRVGSDFAPVVETAAIETATVEMIDEESIMELPPEAYEGLVPVPEAPGDNDESAEPEPAT